MWLANQCATFLSTQGGRGMQKQRMPGRGCMHAWDPTAPFNLLATNLLVFVVACMHACICSAAMCVCLSCGGWTLEWRLHWVELLCWGISDMTTPCMLSPICRPLFEQPLSMQRAALLACMHGPAYLLHLQMSCAKLVAAKASLSSIWVLFALKRLPHRLFCWHGGVFKKREEMNFI